jgi:KDO2-lipid IV(A) lauroyltransferase
MRLEYYLVRFVFTILKTLPVKFAYFLGYQIGKIAYMILHERRSIVTKNLCIVKGWLEEIEGYEQVHKKLENIELATKEVFSRNAANLLSSFSFSTLSKQKMNEVVRLNNPELIKSASKEGNGIILLVAHMGPWEALPSVIVDLATDLGLKLGAIYRPLNNDLIDHWYRGQREIKGVELFDRKLGLRSPFKFLNDGGILALLADQRVKNGDYSKFFGHAAMTTPLVGLLAKRTNAPVISLTPSYNESCKLKITFRKVCFDTAQERTDFSRSTNEELERMLCSDITSGFWLHRRFLV